MGSANILLYSCAKFVRNQILCGSENDQDIEEEQNTSNNQSANSNQQSISLKIKENLVDFNTQKLYASEQENNQGVISYKNNKNLLFNQKNLESNPTIKIKNHRHLYGMISTETYLKQFKTEDTSQIKNQSSIKQSRMELKANQYNEESISLQKISIQKITQREAGVKYKKNTQQYLQKLYKKSLLKAQQS